MLRMGTKAWVGESIWVTYKVYVPYNEYMNMGIQLCIWFAVWLYVRVRRWDWYIRVSLGEKRDWVSMNNTEGLETHQEMSFLPKQQCCSSSRHVTEPL